MTSFQAENFKKVEDCTKDVENAKFQLILDKNPAENCKFQ